MILHRGPATRLLDYGLAAQGVVFDPITGTALALTAVGAGVSAYGTLSGGEAAQHAGIQKAQAALVGSEMVANAQVEGGEREAAAAETGSAMVAKAQREGGDLAQQGAEFQAEQADKSALTERALGQRNAMERRRDTKLALSTLQARAAASGAGASDQTIQYLAKDIAERGEYLALGAMFKGEETARGFTDQAKGLRFTGAAQKYGANVLADTSEFAGKSAADLARWKGATNAKTTLFSGKTTADSSIFEGNAKNDAAGTAALGTILGAAGSMFKPYSPVLNKYGVPG